MYKYNLVLKATKKSMVLGDNSDSMDINNRCDNRKRSHRNNRTFLQDILEHPGPTGYV